MSLSQRQHVALLVASLTLLADRGVKTYAHRHVPLLGEHPLYSWLALGWQTALPGMPLGGVTRSLWLALSIAILVGLVGIVRQPYRLTTTVQAVAIGLLVGGTASHLIDLLRWGQVVTPVHLVLPQLGVDAQTGIGRLAQWGGLAGLFAHVMLLRRRRE